MNSKTNSSIRIKTRLKLSGGTLDFSAFAGVFFLLLLFFMMGSSFVQVSGIPVDLPQAHSADSMGLEKFVVTVDRYGKIFFNDMAVPGLDILKENLLERAGSSADDRTPSSTLIIRADSSSPFGTVAKIMALAEELKINAFVLTLPPAAKVEQREFTDKEK